MKKIILSALLIGLLTACTDDDKESQSIAGKWQTIKFESYTNNTLEASQVFEQENNSCPDFTEFKSDGSCQRVNMDANCVQKTAENLGTYTFDGSILKITAGEKVETNKVASVTATEFIIEQTSSGEGNNYKIKIYFKKLN